MSIEKDLLIRAKVLIECLDTSILQDQADIILSEIKELLAQPEQEPVAWMSINNNGGISIDNYYANHKDYVPLYFAPPKRRPLTDEEIYSIGNKYAFHAAVREIERIHGIGI